MKLRKSIILGLTGLLGLTSCNDWLDVNENPNNPSDQTAPYYARLAYIQYFTDNIYFTGGTAANLMLGDWVTNGSVSRASMSRWENLGWRETSCYQRWYCGAAANFEAMLNSASAAGAYHYMGVTHVIKAYGYMVMADLHGELPYNDACGSNVTPVYNTGKEMYQLCFEDLEKGIEYLEMDQAHGARTLAENDSWAAGDRDKWLKFAYLLKARWLVKLNKKGAGSAADLKYDAQEILNCLAKGPQSNADNMIAAHQDQKNAVNAPITGENSLWSPAFSCLTTNFQSYVTNMLYDNLTDFAGNGVEDPRADKLIPWSRSVKSATTPDYIVWSKDGKWRRSQPVDMQTDIRLVAGGPITPAYKNGRFVIEGDAAEANPVRLNDTIYVGDRSGSIAWKNNANLLYLGLDSKNADMNAATSGTFYNRPSSPSVHGSYAEACFIKAEVLFNQGKKSEAFNAYKAGIQANIEMMNEQLDKWNAETDAYAGCPSFERMEQADIDNYINNGIGTESTLTLGMIMTQKRIAMVYSIELWNDMRRYDYDSNIFLNWKIPYEYTVRPNAQQVIPLGKYPRRWKVSSHEINYNFMNLEAIGASIPGASEGRWWDKSDMYTLPVWWDSTQE